MPPVDHALTTFIGVDLAWRSDRNPSGLAVLRGNARGAELATCLSLDGLNTVLRTVWEHATDNTVVAIDAPLIIRNTRGQRPCETTIGKKFSRYRASAHTSNLSLYPRAGGVLLAEQLVDSGFSHSLAPTTDKERPGRWFFEVYPHPAQVVLFGLDERIRYKKGRIDEKRVGLSILRSLMRERLLRGTPPLADTKSLQDLWDADLQSFRGKALKRYEDMLDAAFCAYLAYYYWAWGAERNELIGDLETGYIINPTTEI